MTSYFFCQIFLLFRFVAAAAAVTQYTGNKYGSYREKTLCIVAVELEPHHAEMVGTMFENYRPKVIASHLFPFRTIFTFSNTHFWLIPIVNWAIRRNIYGTFFVVVAKHFVNLINTLQYFMLVCVKSTSKHGWRALEIERWRKERKRNMWGIEGDIEKKRKNEREVSV